MDYLQFKEVKVKCEQDIHNETEETEFKEIIEEKIFEEKEEMTYDSNTSFVCVGIIEDEVSKEQYLEEDIRMPSTSTGSFIKQEENCKLEDQNYRNTSEKNAKVIVKSEILYDKRLKCKYCDYQTNQKSNFERHLRSHSGEKPFKCRFCDFKCAQKTNIVTHERKHTGEKPFSCKYCDFRTTGNTSLFRHERTHTGEKPFKCDQCTYSCSLKFALEKHKLLHTGEKPYNCSYCDFKCSRKYHLVSHIRTHTGERPFKCPHCDYEAVQGSNLVTHMKKHR